MEVYTIVGFENPGGLMFDAILSGVLGGESPQEGREVWWPQASQFPFVKLREEQKTGRAKL